MDTLPLELLTEIALSLPTLESVGTFLLLCRGCAMAVKTGHSETLLKKRFEREIPRTLLVKTLTGRDVPIRYMPTSTIGEVKQRFQDKEGTPSDQQLLIYAGNMLFDDDVVLERIYGDRNTVDLVLGRPLPDTRKRNAQWKYMF
jgi:Ubiquitin family